MYSVQVPVSKDIVLSRSSNLDHLVINSYKSITLSFADAADISDGLLDLNTPSTQREKMVFKFLTEDRNPKPLLVDDQKPIGIRAKSAEANVLSDMV